MICSNVALGVVRKFTSSQSHLVDTPDGFDSVQGIATGPLKTTDFPHDQFVIFKQNQHHLSYLVEFSSEIGDEPFCVDCNKAKPTELRILPVFSSDIATEDMPSLLPPLSPSPPLRTGGLMLKGKTKDEKTGFCPVSMRASHITAKIVDLVAEVSVTQYYVNTLHAAEPSTYVLPLDATTAVCGFQCFVDGHQIVVKMQERTSVKQSSEDDYPAQESLDIFSVDLGLLQPGANVITVVKYVTELSVGTGEVRFKFPSYLTPTREDIEKDPENPNLGCTLQVAIEMPHDISSLTSPTHEIHTKRIHTRGSVTLACEAQRLAEDFELNIGLEEPHATRMWLEEDESGHCVSMLTFNPRFDVETYQESEILFLVDASSSMQMALPDIQRILRAFLSHLQSVKGPVKFNVITFAQSSTRLFLSNQPLSAITLQAAWKYVNEMKVHYGGTDIYSPLHSLYIRQFLTQIHSSIFLFTDGHTNQQDKLLSLVKQNSSRVRLFTYGVGHNPSRHFIKSLAEAGNGWSNFVVPDKAPNPQLVADLITRAMQPAYCISVKFDTRDKNSIQAPAKLLPVFPGQTRLVLAFAGKCTHANVVTVGPGGRISETSVHVREEGFVKGDTLHYAFARMLMSDQHTGTLSSIPFIDDLKKKQMKEEIVKLSMKYSMESRFTCYGEPEQVELQQGKLPVFTEMVKKIKCDNLPHVVWKEVEEARLKYEERREVENYREDLMDSAKRAKERESNRDFADFMYKIARLKLGWTMDELRQLGKSTRSVVKPILDELKEESCKLVFQGKENESAKLKRARKAIQNELEQFVELLDTQVEPFVTSAEDKAYVQKLKERSKKVLARAAQDLDQTAINMTKKRKIKVRVHLYDDEEPEEGEEEEEEEEGKEGENEKEEDEKGEKEEEEEERDKKEREEYNYETVINGKERKLVKIPSYENYLLNYNKIYGNNREREKERKKVEEEREREKEREKESSVIPTVFIKLHVVDVPFAGTGVEVNYHRAHKQCFHKQKAEEAAAEALRKEQEEAAAAEAGPSEEQKEAKAEEDLAKTMLPTEDELAVKAKKGKKKGEVDPKKNLRLLVKNSMLLKKLKMKFIIPLVDAMVPKPYRAGRYVIREGDRGDYFYIVESGNLEVLKKSGAHDQSVGQLSEGSCFGEVALWFNENRSASVRATSECQLWMVGREAFCKHTYHLRSFFDRSALRYHALLSGLTDYERAMINYIGELRKCNDQYLFREGETLSYFYIVVWGTLEGIRGGKKAAGFSQLAYQGYKSITSGAPAKFSVKANGQAEVLLVNGKDFIDYVVPAVHRVTSFECLT